MNATHVIYSTDDGLNWNDLQFSVSPVSNTSIRLVSFDPDSRVFLITGHKFISSSSMKLHFHFLKLLSIKQLLIISDTYVPVVFHVDFTPAFNHECTDTLSDFSRWSATDEHGHCFLGGVTTFRRREIGKPCFYPHSFSFEVNSSECECSLLDYECAPCYEREFQMSTCIMTCAFDDDMQAPPNASFCDLDSPTNPIFYQANGGYQKITESVCYENSASSFEKPRGQIPCSLWRQKHPSNTSNLLNKKLLIPALFISLLLVIIVVGVVWFLFKYNAGFRDYVYEMMEWRRENEYQQIDYAQHVRAFDMDIDSMEDDELDLDV